MTTEQIPATDEGSRMWLKAPKKAASRNFGKLYFLAFDDL